MKLMHSLPLALACAALGASAAPADMDAHGAHHPAAGASAPSGKAMPDATRVDSQMKAMQDMHARMMAAKTPADRDALMAEHMKVMQDGMAMMDGMPSDGMMGGMKGGMKGGMAAQHRTMESRMAMMQATMQMMMDRLPVPPVLPVQ